MLPNLETVAVSRRIERSLALARAETIARARRVDAAASGGPGTEWIAPATPRPGALARAAGRLASATARRAVRSLAG
jgi:hypothetical protein